MSIEAMRLALEALERIRQDTFHPAKVFAYTPAIIALRQAIAEEALDKKAENARELGLNYEPEQEPVTILPDGSAFGVMSWPLPKDHWLYAEREYRDGEYEPMELGNPILTHQLRDEVVSAVRYAIRGATNCGKDVDFDPDALVQNAVYALCGPYSQLSTTQPQEAAPLEQEPVAYTGNGTAGREADIKPTGFFFQADKKQEPAAWITQGGKGWLRWHKSYDDNKDSVPLYTQPQEAAPLEQEFVAWGVDWGKAGDTPCVSIIKRLPNGGIEVLAVEYAPYSYTSPPQRKPLTDEEINKLREVNSEGRGRGFSFNFKGFARAIEAAHGIGKNK